MSYGVHSHAQTSNEFEDLKSVLQLLENDFNITFSYLNESIEDLKVEQWQQPYELKDYLNYIEEQTNLKITRLDERYYAIKVDKRTSIGRICGYLKNHETKQSIGQVAVTAGSLNTISGIDGFFEIKGVPLDELVIFRHVGFEPVSVPARKFSDDSCSDIELKERLSALDEVIIYNYIAKGIEKRLNGVYSISNEQLQVLPGIFDRDVMQSLQVLPGVYSANESVADINIRGGTGDQNLTLWDGIRMYQTGHFFGLISVFNPYFTSEVSLTKNATSPGLGEAVSSVIDIRGPKDQVKSFSIQGGINMLNLDLETEVPVGKKTSLFIGGRQSISGLMQTPTYDQYYERAFGDILSTNYSPGDSILGEVDRFNYSDIGLKFVHEPSPTSSWELSMLNVNDELGFQEKSTSTGAISKSSSVEQSSQGISLSHQKKWSDRWTTSGQGYYSYYLLQAENRDLVNDQFLNQENEVKDWQVKVQATYKFSDRLKWLNGYNFNERGITNIDQLNRPAFNRKIKEVIGIHSLFTEAIYSDEGNKTVASFGVRYNHFNSLEEQAIEPRLLINRRIANKWALELAGELRSQTSLQVIDLQNDFLGIEKRRWVQSNNDDLPIVKSKQISAGLLFADMGWQLSVEGYLKRVTGIVTSSQSFRNQFELIRSVGEYNISGMDLLLNYQVEKVSAWMSYTISRNMNKFKELLTDEFPGNVDIRHFISSGLNYSSSKFECSLGVNWHTGNPFTKPMQNQPVLDGNINYQFPNSSNLPHYFRLDMAAKYNFTITETIKSQFGISFWNITDHSNSVNAYFTLSETDQINEVIENGLGFTPNVMFRMIF